MPGYHAAAEHVRHAVRDEPGAAHAPATRETATSDAPAPTHTTVPRDRNGTFEPAIVRKRQRRLDGLNDAIISLYARGMTVRDIQAHLTDIYGVDVSPDLISKVTDAVAGEVTQWQNRPLGSRWAVLFVDALWIKIREGQVTNRPVYVVVGVDFGGAKHVLGRWVGKDGEGAKCVLQVGSRHAHILDTTVNPDGRGPLSRSATWRWISMIAQRNSGSSFATPGVSSRSRPTPSWPTWAWKS
ncbi:IS256 family transposase [Amycolatopsis cihanbeyliensis]|uniref:IS256 family transposase n=1 Tax=Amycolatopsis cihanbeyliensis TaxID=1128664 RepID=UPI002482EF6A|nr:transposase [Amycolatopsis cihanbeyliensis]